MSIALAAITIGLAAGLKPGPLGVYVIHQTLAKGLRHGLMASVAPMITDGPIVLFAFLVTQEISDINWLIGIIALAGSAYLLVIAYRIYKTPPSDALQNPSDLGQSSFFGAIKLNVLNPSPYVFWFTIGGSFMAAGTTAEAWIFAIFMSASLCLTKFLVAAAIKILGDRINPRIYAATLRLLAFPLVLFSVQLLHNGITRLTA